METGATDEEKIAEAVSRAMAPIAAQLASIVTLLQGLITSNSALEKRVAAIESKPESPAVPAPDLDGMEIIDRKLAEIEDRDRRRNLVFHGLPQCSPDQVETEIVKFCKTLNLEVSEKDLERSHFLGLSLIHI